MCCIKNIWLNGQLILRYKSCYLLCVATFYIQSASGPIIEYVHVHSTYTQSYISLKNSHKLTFQYYGIQEQPQANTSVLRFYILTIKTH